ncbi:hypothetical protein NL676_003739 [Syzygium grande]|nr:hypothetical protein NL676_003739 [Syzygium grande]
MRVTRVLDGESDVPLGSDKGGGDVEGRKGRAQVDPELWRQSGGYRQEDEHGEAEDGGYGIYNTVADDQLIHGELRRLW